MNIIWKKPDGLVAITSTVDDSKKEAAKLLKLGSVPNDWKPVAYDVELPKDITWIDAWEFDGSKIQVNLPAAKEVTKVRLRLERLPSLSKLDVDYMKALETDADTTQILQEKNRLRDLPELADSAENINQLLELKA